MQIPRPWFGVVTLQRQTSMASSRPNSERSTTPRAMLLAVALFTSMLMGVHSQDTLRYVTSGDQLQRATTDGVRIIVVTDHLHLASPPDAEGSGPLLTLNDSTEAILVRLDVLYASCSQITAYLYRLASEPVVPLLHEHCTRIVLLSGKSLTISQ